MFTKLIKGILFKINYSTFRIDEILRRKTRKRIQDTRIKEQEGDSHSTLPGGGGKNQPTLPNIDVDLDDRSVSHAQYYYANGYNQYQDYLPSESGSSVFGNSYYNNYYQQGPTETSNSFVYQAQNSNKSN